MGIANPPLPPIWKTAFGTEVVRRALVMSAIVGTVLMVINHGDCMLKGHFSSNCVIKSALTFFVPYAVSTISSVQAIRCRARCASL